jgi:hypothetical protein
MQSFVSVMPGETVSCVGCHERRVRAPHDRRQSYLQALTRGPSRIQQVPGVPASGLIDFPRDIQPILDRHCVKCHNPDKAGGGVRLDGARTPRWTFGYSSLIEKAQTGMAGGYYDRAQFGNMPPRTFGSPVSKLLAKVRTGHGDVKLSETDKSLLRAWVDSSACFAGTQQSLVLPEPSFPRLESGKFVDMVLMDKCAACHLPDKGRTRWPWQRDTWIDLADPARSHLVRAPLASSAGGLGLCRQRKARSSGQAPDGEQARNAPPANVFTSTDDQAYRALVQEIGDIMAGKGPGWRPADVTRPTYWQEGYVPHEWWVREMVRAGVLPAGWRSNANTDWFAIDERYYLLFRPVAERRNGGLARED